MPTVDKINRRLNKSAKLDREMRQVYEMQLLGLTKFDISKILGKSITWVTARSNKIQV